MSMSVVSQKASIVVEGDARLVHLAEILEESTDYVATTDVDGIVVYANRAFRERFGLLTVDGITSERYSLFSFFTEESRRTFLREAVPALWSGGRWSGEIEALDPEGTPITLWQSAIAHLGADGLPTYFSGIARDMSAIAAAQEDMRASEARFRALVAQGTDMILVLSGEGRITYASPAVERVLGHPVSRLLGTVAFDLIHPDDVTEVITRFLTVGVAGSKGNQYRVRRASGGWRWLESFATNHMNTPGIDGYILNARDITARHEADEKLAEAAALLSSVMRAAASEAIFVTDREARIVAFSLGAECLLGYAADEVVGVLHPRVFHPEEDIAALAAEVGVTPDGLFHYKPPAGQSLAREWTFVRKDGSTFDGSLIVSARFDEHGELAGFLYLAADITERRHREAMLTQQAESDVLTGLANRQCLQRALGVAVGNTSWHSPGRVLLFIDLDRFKQVNDTHGHAVGDAVLVAVAERLEENLRPGDLAVRLGGDEFVVLLEESVTHEFGMIIAQRIVAAIAADFVIGSQRISIGASVGLSVSRFGWTAEELVLAADGAAYVAKRNGRGGVAASAVN
jgi:diguanylate cyclase (GGDEF)-like protein/PAS domain S-box-containing protein